MACGVSITVALSLRKLADKALAGKTGFVSSVAGYAISYAAVALAGNANVYIIR